MATVDMPSMDPSKLPNNSYTARERREQETSETLSKAVEASKKPLEPVAHGKARKPSLVKRFARYIVEDSIENAREKTLGEIVIPGIKTLIFDTLTDMLDIVLFGGEGAPMGRYSASAGASKRMSYSKFYEEKTKKGSGSERRAYRDAYEADDIILDTRNQANNVLNTLYGHIQKYGQVSVATYYDIVGVTGEWTDNRYGWTNINGAGIKPVREGFVIILPPARLLEE